MNKERNKFCEKVRVIAAKKLDIPPDDIDMISIMNCVERAIKKSCEKENGEIIISFENNLEEKAILVDGGMDIINMIFDNDDPFVDFVSNYQEWYATGFLKNLYKKEMNDE